MAGKVTGGGKGRQGPRQPGYMKKGGKVGGQQRQEGRGPQRPGFRGQEGQRPEAAGRERPEGLRQERPKAAGRERPAKSELVRGQAGRRESGSLSPRAARPLPSKKPSFSEKPAVEAPPPQKPPEEVVAGVNPVLELLRSGGRPLDAVYIDKDKGGKLFEEVLSLARRSGVQVKVVPRQALDGMAQGLRHQGALALVSPKAYADPYNMVERAGNKGTFPLIVILDGVEDPQNLGAIIRTAEAAGADGVVIPEHRAAHLTSAVARASAGALEHMPVAKVANLANYISYLKEKGFWVIGLAGEGTKEYTTFDMNVPLAVVLGSEGTGIRPLVRKSCDALLYLPMLGKVSSLNVSVAAGVALFEVIRQRKSAKSAT